MIHKFSMQEINVVIDVYSGAVHVVDDVVYDLLDYAAEIEDSLNEGKECPEEIIGNFESKYSDVQIQGAYKEISQLKEQGLMFSEDLYEQYISFWDKQSVVKALCLHIAHDCNLRCKYCFASTGSFHGSRSLMSSDIGKKAIDFVIANSGKRKNIEIDFFGGEPLMNFGVVKEVVEYAKEKGQAAGKVFRFTITTNGLLLSKEIQEYINENMCNIVLSLDGTKTVNDNMRPRIDGRGCYDQIVPKFKEVAESRGQDNYYVRGTFTRHNLNFAEDVLHLADLGFKQTSVEPVVAHPSEDYALREEDLPILFKEYEKLAVQYLKRKKEGNGFNFFHFMIDLTQGPCAAKRLSGCGSGYEYMAVTPEGDIYPCHQFVGNEEFKMGNVSDGQIQEDIKKIFTKSNVYTKGKCKDCWAKFYCSGGCPANAYQFNGDIDEPYAIGCELEKKRVECALMIQAAQAIASTL